MPYDPDKHHRRSIRLPGYDYTSTGVYFVTICTRSRERLFGSVQAGNVRLSAAGRIVWDCWNDLPNHYAHVSLDAFVAMPDHVHGLVVLNDNNGLLRRHGLPEVVRALKTFSARRINELRGTPGIPVWQRNYYDRIVRSEPALLRIRAYINANPSRWIRQG